jgi:proteasome accessory factor B
MHPLERLLNLLALLLNATRPLTFEEIRARVPAYQQDDLASAKRMFERDKDALRDVGVPVDLTSTDVWEVEKGYRIVKERYYLPDIDFTPDEMWALFVAAHTPGEDGEAERAFQKPLPGGA